MNLHCLMKLYDEYYDKDGEKNEYYKRNLEEA